MCTEQYVRIYSTVGKYTVYTVYTGADITGQLQVRPMLYTLYIDINLSVVKMLQTDNKQQITKWKQSPYKRRSYVTPGGALQFRPMVYTLYIGINLTIIMKQYGDRQTDTNI